MTLTNVGHRGHQPSGRRTRAATTSSLTFRRATTRLVSRRPGFRQSRAAVFALRVNDTQSHDFALKVGDISQTIEVTAQAALLQQSTSELGTVINEESVRDLPLNGRNFSQLLTLTPGATPVSTAQGTQWRHGLQRAGRAAGLDLHPALDQRSVEPFQHVHAGRHHQPLVLRRQLGRTAHRRRGAGVQGAVAQRQGRVRRRPGRRHEHRLQVRHQPVPRRRLGVPAQRRVRRPQSLHRRHGAGLPRSARTSSAPRSADRSTSRNCTTARTRRSSTSATRAGDTRRSQQQTYWVPTAEELSGDFSNSRLAQTIYDPATTGRGSEHSTGLQADTVFPGQQDPAKPASTR